MLSFVVQLIVFVGVGLLLTAVPEWQNNVLLNAEITGWPGYFGTLRFNAGLLLFAYLTFRYLHKRYSPAKTLVVQCTLWGIIGLVIEGIFIGHPPWSDAIQYGMFVYWAVVFGAPAIFVLEQAKPVRLKLLVFIIGTDVLMIGASIALLNVDPTKGLLLLFTIFSWILICTIIVSFFFRAVGYPPKILLLLSVAIFVSLAEIIVPFPLDFIIFLTVMLCSYWYVTKRLSSKNMSLQK